MKPVRATWMPVPRVDWLYECRACGVAKPAPEISAVAAVNFDTGTCWEYACHDCPRNSKKA